jgi:transposase-like protein
MQALVEKRSVEEVFRQELEDAINHLLQTELASFLGYEKHSSEGWNSGNSRNGFYPRRFHTAYGALQLQIPRDRNGDFQQQTLPEHKRQDDALETIIIQLYRHGVTTRQISELVEQMYGHYYTPQTVSNIASAVQKQVEEFHNRKVGNHYAVIYCDATYLNLRRDSVAKEALHVILGITPDGHKEILEYSVYPTESAGNYEDLLRKLQVRGLEDVLLFVTDGLPGIRDKLLELFPKAKHQYCYVHLARTISRLVRPKMRKEILADFRSVYRAESAKAAADNLDRFLEKWAGKYSKLVDMFARQEGLFEFYSFPTSIRHSIYTSNLIENNNKGLKHHAKLKEQFPNEASLERFVCTYYSDYNRKQSARIHLGFSAAESELLSMFDNPER